MRRAFTLLELMVACLLLGMLVSALTMLFNTSAVAWRTGTAGVAEIATLAETAEGTDYDRIVTPYTLKAETDKLVHLTGSETITGIKNFSASPRVPTPGTTSNSTVVPNTEWVKALISATLLAAHPVGSYYITEGTERPADLFGGTWEQVKDRVLIGAGYTFDVGSTGGSFNRQLLAANIPSHTHEATTSAAGWHGHVATEESAGEHTHTVSGTSGWMEVGSTSAAGTKTDGTVFTSATTTTKHDDDNGKADGVRISMSIPQKTTSKAGAHTHAVTVSGNGSHTHTVTVESTGEGTAFSILNPYRAVNMWKRTA